MRNYIIAGNWKMFKDLKESTELIKGLTAELPAPLPGTTVVVCPPATSLSLAAELLAGSHIKLGAQNMSEHDEGAYTGEISWKMLKGTGCEYVILGHSERRRYFAETDALVNRKALKAIAAGLRPIICVGETLEEREKGTTMEVVTRQVNGVLAGMTASDLVSVVIAYEPVWAIGTGRNATPAQAQEVHLLIRSLLTNLFGKELATQTIIQYGGSVKPDNATQLLSQNDINGALVGGACLKVDSFSAIVRSAKP
jgi:triosephosphate isomerase